MKSIGEIKNEVNQFLAIRNIDSINEKFPVSKAKDVIERR